MRGFCVYALPPDEVRYEDLLASLALEDGPRGRQGALLTQVTDDGAVPLVRTTARFARAPQRFRPVDERLADAVRRLASLPQAFNNALFERYTRACTTMGAHSDMALDLSEGSSIAVVSCYQHPVTSAPPRKLVLEPKEPGGAPFEVPLAHQTAVVFSLETNRRHRHKIVLDARPTEPENPWLGITFRTAKTFVRHRDGGVFFADGALLALADEAQRRALLGLRGRENREGDFVYPPVGFTLSEGDLSPPSSAPTSAASMASLGASRPV